MKQITEVNNILLTLVIKPCCAFYNSFYRTTCFLYDLINIVSLLIWEGGEKVYQWIVRL